MKSQAGRFLRVSKLSLPVRVPWMLCRPGWPRLLSPDDARTSTRQGNGFHFQKCRRITAPPETLQRCNCLSGRSSCLPFLGRGCVTQQQPSTASACQGRGGAKHQAPSPLCFRSAVGKQACLPCVISREPLLLARTWKSMLKGNSQVAADGRQLRKTRAELSVSGSFCMVLRLQPFSVL